MFNFLKNKKEPKLNEIIAQKLAETTVNQRYEPTQNMRFEAVGNEVHFKQHNIKIICEDHFTNQHGEVSIYMLRFSILLGDKWSFHENLAGYGDTMESIAEVAVNNYEISFLDVFFQQLCSYYEPEHELVFEDDLHYHVLLGDVIVQGGFKDDPTVSKDTFINILKPRLMELLPTLEGDIHYIKVYLSRVNDSFTGECKLNDEHWVEGLSDLCYGDYDHWQETDEFLAKKQVIFLRKCTAKH